MPKTKKRSVKKVISKKKKSSFFNRWSKNTKIAVLFALVFATVGGFMLFRSYAAAGDELQAKGNATWGAAYAKRIVLSPDGSYGFTLDSYGALHPFRTYGTQPKAPTDTPYFKPLELARDVVITHWDANGGLKGYILDGWGAIHPFGGATAVQGNPYWKGWDIARRITLKGTGGYVLDGLGGLHPFKIGSTGVAPPAVKQGPYWPGKDIARDVIIRSDNAYGEILDCHGGISPVGFGTNNAPAYVNGYPYNPNTCSYDSFVRGEWSKPSGVVINEKGEFAGFGTWGVKPYVASGLGKVVDGQCRNVTAEASWRCWLMDDHGNIRAYSEPNMPLFNDQEQAYFAAVKKAQADAAAKAVAATAAAKKAAASNNTDGGRGGSTIPQIAPAQDLCSTINIIYVHLTQRFGDLAAIDNTLGAYTKSPSVRFAWHDTLQWYEAYRDNYVNTCPKISESSKPTFATNALGVVQTVNQKLDAYNAAINSWVAGKNAK